MIGNIPRLMQQVLPTFLISDMQVFVTQSLSDDGEYAIDLICSQHM